MTDTIPPNHQVMSVRHYTAGPPAGLELVEPGETVATTKEEEWVSKKKTELTTTRQIETRVKRQVVLEDGKVVEDSGPIVTTNTTEDTEKQEHSQTEVRKLGDDEPDNAEAIESGQGGFAADKDQKVVVVPNPDGVVREVKERRVVSREETEERRETEDVRHLGDITDEGFLAAVHSGAPDLRTALRDATAAGTISTGPRVVHESSKSRRVTDTEDTDEVSARRADGRIVTETRRTTQHEEEREKDLPEGEAVEEKLVENSQRYQKTKDQELIEYLADGVKIGQEMRYKAETMEGERFGDEAGGEDAHDWDSLSARMRKARKHHQAARNHLQKPRGLDDQVVPPLDRKDALTKKPLDFDEEEETRKAETSKWLEHHFGSDSRSSKDSVEDEEPATTKSFFNVTIKSQPARIPEPVQPKGFVTAVTTNHRVYSPPLEIERPIERTPERPVERTPDRGAAGRNGYFQGISEWSERKHEETDRYKTTTLSNGHTNGHSHSNGNINGHTNGHVNGHSNGYVAHRESPQRFQTIYRLREEQEDPIPVPPERKRAMERRQRSSQDSIRYDSGYRTHSRNETSREDEPQDEPPPDYSPPPQRQQAPHIVQQTTHIPPIPSHPTPIISGSQTVPRKPYQRTRFAAEPTPPKPKGNIIGQSIRKLVGKIRSASAERKSRQRAKRSPSPHTTYQQYNVIDNIPKHETMHSNHNGSHNGGSLHNGSSHNHNQKRRGSSPVQKYYLGEDPFGGSIYGRENKYDGVRPVRGSTKHRVHRRPSNNVEEQVTARSHSTLGRFSKSTGRLSGSNTTDYSRTVQTLPRNSRSDGVKSSATPDTIHVSIINTERPIVNGGPAKPARTYRSALTRSKSLNVHGMDDPRGVHRSSPQLHRLDESPIGLKSPAIVSSLARSTRDLTDTTEYAPRFLKNGHGRTTTTSPDDSRKAWSPPAAYSTPVKGSRLSHYSTDLVHEPPTRLRAETRRGSASTDDYSETYHVTSRSDDPLHPRVTDTVQSFTKKTIPGRGIIESSETKTVTRSGSRYRSEAPRYLENGGNLSSTSNGGVTIQVKNYRH